MLETEVPPVAFLGVTALSEEEITGPERTLQQTFEIWVRPEIERRRRANTLPDPFVLQMAQVIFDPGGGPTVRLNEEVKGVARVRIAKARQLAIGDNVGVGDVDGFEAIELTEEDPNAGHITIIGRGDAWYLSFNFRYNAARIARLFAAANEFMAAAKFSLDQRAGYALVDNLHTAVELMAKAWLMEMPDDALMSSRTHKTIRSKFNQRGRFGSPDGQFVSLYNELVELRRSARYVAEDWVFDLVEGARLFADAQRMQAALDERRPRRIVIQPSATL